jgi:hypothetical protein
MADFTPGANDGIECIHFLYPSKTGKITSGRTNIQGIDPGPGGATQFDVACTPGSTLPTHATGSTVAATCPLCKETDAFKEAEEAEKVGNMSEADKKLFALVAAQKKQRLAEIAAEGK